MGGGSSNGSSPLDFNYLYPLQRRGFSSDKYNKY